MQEWWLRLRDRLLMRPGFQSWAARFPLTRPMARRQAGELFNLTAGFVYSQILYACIDAGLFERLRDGPQSVDALATALDLPPERCRRLLRAAAALGLTQRRGANGQDAYGLGMRGAALLGNPGVGAMVRHHARLYADLRDPLALLRQDQATALSDYWPYARAADPSTLAGAAIDEYSALMAESQSFISADVLAAYSLKGHRQLLDIAGGEGAFIAAAARRWPHLQAGVFDLPAVAARAQDRFTREGLTDRLTAHGGNLFHDELPRGADIVSLVRVLHDHDDEPAMAILRAARAALDPGGVLMIAEPMAGTRGAEPVGDGYFGIYLLAMGSGRPRTAAELTDMARAAGFGRVRERRTAQPMLVRVLTAEV